MGPSKLKEMLRPVKRLWSASAPEIDIHNTDSFLRNISGVIHVGANEGQERGEYAALGLNVVWVEPIPSVFAKLKSNLKHYVNQHAIQALVTDVEGQVYEFNVANNNGASSSILDLKQHRDIWPTVKFTSTISISGITLPSLLKKEQIDPSKYQGLILDTQGSELLVLKGSIPILDHFRYIKTEVPDFESYENCCQLVDIEEFMNDHGYEEVSRSLFARRNSGGNYFDIVFEKRKVIA